VKTIDRLVMSAAVFAVSVGCDQATKHLATKRLVMGPTRSYLGDLFRLQYAENRGAFLSMGADLSHGARWWLLTVGVAAILLALLVYSLTSKALTRIQVASFALIFSGGVSNLIDRITQGGVVVDFMNLGLGPVRTGIFNVADLAIVAGVVALVLYRKRPEQVTQPPQPPQDVPAG
jgi:signal peptidase II